MHPEFRKGKDLAIVRLMKFLREREILTLLGLPQMRDKKLLVLYQSSGLYQGIMESVKSWCIVAVVWKVDGGVDQASPKGVTTGDTRRTGARGGIEH